MRFSNLLSKNVISLYNGTNEGIIISGYFDEHLKKLKSLELVSQNEINLSDEYLLSVKNVYTIGEDAIMIKNNTMLELKSNITLTEVSPINSYAYNINGKLIGKITDIEFDDKFNIVKYIIDEYEIEASKMASFSKGTILFYDDDSDIKVERFRPNNAKFKINEAKKLESELPKAYILPTFEASNIENDEENINIDTENGTKTLELISKSPINSRIERLSANSNLLIGKKITKTIATANGELIGKKGNLVTSKTIYLATTHQKLRELVLYCE